MVTEKIKKLLALSSSPNKNEAEVALKKAFMLMAKHDVSDEDVKERKYEELVLLNVIPGLGVPEQVIPINHVLTNHFNVICVNQGDKFSAFGKKHHLEIVRYVFVYLDRLFIALAKDKQQKREYYYGLAVGFSNFLYMQKTKMKEEEGLVVVDPYNDIEKFLLDEHNMYLSNRNTRLKRGESYHDGKEDGARIRINPAIKNSKSPRRYLA